MHWFVCLIFCKAMQINFPFEIIKSLFVWNGFGSSSSVGRVFKKPKEA